MEDLSSFCKSFQLGLGILMSDFASQKQLYLQFGWTDFDEIKNIFHFRKFPITYTRTL
jgi:hypothetical protein